MAGDLNETGLFGSRKVVTQDPSSLLERWQQEDSTPFNFSGTPATGATIRVVPSGKFLAIKSLTINPQVLADSTTQLTVSCTIAGPGIGGTGTRFLAICNDWANGRVEHFDFPVPLLVACTVTISHTFSSNPAVHITGWEERFN